ncbi:MAG: nucleoside triphosphate pyrophosphohydrolase [Candidatus Competibacterales bacterium]
MENTRGLLALMARLRDPDTGCPWDRAQTFATIAPYTIEEAFEVADAVARGDVTELKDELGDLLFQVVFHARLAEERGDFDFEAVAAAVVAKLIRRHPHVFGDAAFEGFEALNRSWEAIKQREKANAPSSLMDDLPKALPALGKALKLQRRAARGGFDWPAAAPVLAKLREELDELEEAFEGETPEAVAEELGDLLFACVNFARHCRLDPEMALARANVKFEGRFRRMEALAQGAETSLDALSLDDLEALWRRAKAEEAAGKSRDGGS